MCKDFSKFDKFKRNLSKRWSEVSVYNIEEMSNLVTDSFKPFVYSLLNIGLNVNDHFNSVFKQIKREYLCFRITGKDKIKENLKNNLEFFLEGENLNEV